MVAPFKPSIYGGTPHDYGNLRNFVVCHPGDPLVLKRQSQDQFPIEPDPHHYEIQYLWMDVKDILHELLIFFRKKRIVSHRFPLIPIHWEWLAGITRDHHPFSDEDQGRNLQQHKRILGCSARNKLVFIKVITNKHHPNKIYCAEDFHAWSMPFSPYNWRYLRSLS